MHVIFARNPAHALISVMDLCRSGPTIEMKKESEPDAKAVEYRVVPFPIATILGEPTERVIPWPWWEMDPLTGFLHGLQILVSSYEFLKQRLGNCQEMNTLDFKIADATDQTATFKISVHGKLDMVVFDRSRVGVAYLFGIAMVRYTMVLELLAAILKVPMGVYTHVSGDLVTTTKSLPFGEAPPDSYTLGTIRQYPMIEGDVESFIRDATMLVSEGPVLGIQNKFIKEVASPIWKAFNILNGSEDVKRFGSALEIVKRCRASDWRSVSEEFISKQASNFLMDQVPPALHLVN